MPPNVLPLKTLREAAEGQLYAPTSVCAWVTWFSVPRNSRGSDLYVLLHLSDITLSGEGMEVLRNSSTERVMPDEPPYVTCTIFGPLHLLPQFPAQDEPRIIYLHRTKMVMYNGERQLRVKLEEKGGPSGDTYSIYAVAGVAHPERDPPVLIATSHHVTMMPQQDPVAPLRIQALRRWILETRRMMQLPGPHQAPSAAPAGQLRPYQPPEQTREVQDQEAVLKTVQELAPPLATDRVTPVVGPMAPASLICKVLAVDFSHYPDYYILHVWDGTNALPMPLSYTSTPTTAGGGPTPPPASAVGWVRNPQPLPRPGDWIKLKDMVPRFVQGQLQLLFAERSSLDHRPGVRNAGAPTAGESRGEHPAQNPPQQRGGAGGQPSPFPLQNAAPRDPSSWLARVCHPWRALPLRTLRQVLMQQDTCDCTPARVLVRVMAVLNPPLPPPPSPAVSAVAASTGPRASTTPSGQDRSDVSVDSTSPAAHQLRTSLLRAVLPAAALRCEQEVVGTQLDRSGNGRTFALALLLQDATASLRAVVLGGAANLFLWDLPPPSGDVAARAAATWQGQQRPPQQQSESQLQSSAVSQSNPLRVMTRSRAKMAAAVPAVAPDAAAAPATAAPDAAATAVPPAQREEPGQQCGQAGLDDWDKLFMALRWLSEQSGPEGTWMEAVLRPMYRDRGNPWQSAVYSLEHTVLQLPQHLKNSAAAAERGQGSAPGMGMDSRGSVRLSHPPSRPLQISMAHIGRKSLMLQRTHQAPSSQQI
ncbi:hypothetical protein VOLCADRAFT_91120 [Volvox carteri f. nagariensis]|uniref:Telomeric single stranded DNA binding POT1/Cdc13 domain-containing protein n=1 Tax=Volvox carteri f. nagariensis TaxID=3068 RepID=D8TW84_VOLCA|nr:uncharacterized protein VOLCADRAFT_91120 [Volvox carteri f. nagariensis]EFJ48429.1 hypothetical protein VOLCADRAFT_91120 [Volvox carteri f. nagariensis]|eukprot:XP_002950683.1 hypothetical protein VOLCADRAFT_91120 [Volvox carteri f. nagariensis]